MSGTLAEGSGEGRSARPSGPGSEAPEEDDNVGNLEPRDFWEAHSAKQQLARFSNRNSDGSNQGSQAMPMLVAVRLRPMWDKELEVGDYNCIRIVDGKMVIVLDPWYDPDHNKNRDQEKRYAFDKVFDDEVGQERVYEETAHGLVRLPRQTITPTAETHQGITHTVLECLRAFPKRRRAGWRTARGELNVRRKILQ